MASTRRRRILLLIALVTPLGSVLAFGSAYAQIPGSGDGFQPGGIGAHPGGGVPPAGFPRGGLPPGGPFPPGGPGFPPGGFPPGGPGMPGGGIGGNFGNQGGFTGGPRFPSGPIIERIWKCTGCGAELGRGGTRPSMDICPGCNARIINGPSGGRVNPGPGFNPGPAFNPDPVVINPPAFNPPPAPVVHPFARQNFNPAPSSKGFGFGSTDGSDAAVWIILATLGGVGIVAGILIGVGRSMRF